jgi:adenylate kinase
MNRNVVAKPFNLEDMKLVAEGIVRMIKDGVSQRVHVSGPPGIGKVSVYRDALERHKVPYQMLNLHFLGDLTPDEVTGMMTKIFERGGVVILDETRDISSELEQHINTLSGQFVQEGGSVIIFKTGV